MDLTKNSLLAIGLMSGTSMDGVDCALVESDSTGVRPFGKAVHLPYDAAMRAEISAAMKMAAGLQNPQGQHERTDRLEKKLTLVHADAVSRILQTNNIKPGDVDVIGFHGQTLRHRPDKGWSWQIGDGQMLARETSIPVVNDFRRQDVENGGQGAPLVPVYHLALIRQLKPDYPLAIINIGGVSNITWAGSDREDQLLAFDTGPGNAFLDDWVHQHTGEAMDRDGLLAARGKVDYLLVEEWLDDPFFTNVPPKSLDRYSFEITGLDGLSLEDGAATLLHFTVKSIEAALGQCPQPPQHIYICGGGRHNRTLMSELGKPGIPVDAVEKIGWHGDFLEAEAFGYLACRHLRSLPITFPGTTGVKQPGSGGKLYRP